MTEVICYTVRICRSWYALKQTLYLNDRLEVDDGPYDVGKDPDVAKVPSSMANPQDGQSFGHGIRLM